MQALRPYWLASLSIIGLIIVRLFVAPSNIINPDCSMFLRAGEILINGGVPYTDFVELNPPLVFYLHTIPAYFANLSGLSPETCLYIFTLLLFAFSLFLCWNLLKDQSEQSAASFGPIIVAFCLGNLICYEWVQFGQRQQLLVNALLPFFVCRYLRWHDYKTNMLVSIISGLLAGSMICLLPQYAAIVFSLETFYVWQKRQLRPLLAPENISALVCALAYGLFIWAYEPLKTEFVGRWMPMVNQGYALYNWPWPMQITQLVVSGILPAITIALLFILAKKIKLDKQGLFLPIVVFCLGALLAIVLQGKCILNQTIPLMYGSLMLGCSVGQNNNFKSTLVASITTLLVFLTPVYLLPGVISQNQTWQTMTTKIATFINKESNPGDRISVLSLSLPDSYPALPAAQRQSGNRYFFVFPLLMTDYLEKKNSGKAAAAHWQEESLKFVGDLNSDLKTNKPRLVLIQENVIPTADISVRKYLEKTSFWPSLNADYDYTSTIKAGVSELSVWKHR